MKSQKYIVAAFVALLVVLGCTHTALEQRAGSPGETVQAPVFEVDPLWPKPLPNQWLLGMTIGVWVDEDDNVWIIHRSSATLNNNERGAELNPPTGECCRGAPPVLVFNQAGALPGHALKQVVDAVNGLDMVEVHAQVEKLKAEHVHE